LFLDYFEPLGKNHSFRREVLYSFELCQQHLWLLGAEAIESCVYQTACDLILDPSEAFLFPPRERFFLRRISTLRLAGMHFVADAQVPPLYLTAM
jgi:hypothetical protein